MPVQALPTQVWLTHDVAAFQVPVAPHVCCCVRPLHWTSPGAHVPWQAATPDVTTQVWLVHVAGAPHAPPAVHVSTPFDTHCV
jgi:hypothetical protein